MPRPQTRFQWLAQQFDRLVETIHECEDPKKRQHLLRRMKVLVDEIDVAVSSSLKKDKQDTTSSFPPDQPTGD
jgi:hypothetical protein